MKQLPPMTKEEVVNDMLMYLEWLENNPDAPYKRFVIEWVLACVHTLRFMLRGQPFPLTEEQQERFKRLSLLIEE